MVRQAMTLSEGAVREERSSTAWMTFVQTMEEIIFYESTEFKVLQFEGYIDIIFIRVESFEKKFLPRVEIIKKVCHIYKNVTLVIENCFLIHSERLHIIAIHSLA